jgi:hypothetical protein
LEQSRPNAEFRRRLDELLADDGAHTVRSTSENNNTDNNNNENTKNDDNIVHDNNVFVPLAPIGKLYTLVISLS